MKASKMIETLKQLVACEGDLDVSAHVCLNGGDYGEYVITSVEKQLSWDDLGAYFTIKHHMYHKYGFEAEEKYGMKASKLIEQLTNLANIYGDKEILLFYFMKFKGWEDDYEFNTYPVTDIKLEQLTSQGKVFSISYNEDKIYNMLTKQHEQYSEEMLNAIKQRNLVDAIKLAKQYKNKYEYEYESVHY